MSMNLNASCSKGNIDLWQTPTQISYTILPSTFGEIKGVKAKEALQRYMEWVRYSTNGKWSNLEELNSHKENVKEHLEYIESFLEAKGLRVWVM